MQEKESIMVLRCELKIASFWLLFSITRNFNPHLTTIKDSYYPIPVVSFFLGGGGLLIFFSFELRHG